MKVIRVSSRRRRKKDLLFVDQKVKVVPCGSRTNQDQGLCENEFLKKHIKKIVIGGSLILLIVIAAVTTAEVLSGKNTFEEYTTTELPSTATTKHSSISDIRIIKREEWGGRTPLSVTNLESPAPLVIVKHTGGKSCSDVTSCSELVKSIQSEQVSKGAPDIWYNYLIGGDGNVYVGRGFGVQNEQRNDSIDVCYMGDFSVEFPTYKMILAGKKILINGVVNLKLAEDYIVVNHNQTEDTISPGEHIYVEVEKWPNFYNGTI